MNIGIDIHGTADRYPNLFMDLVDTWRASGHVIHIITGESGDTARKQISDLNIPYDKFFSITDWASGQNCPIERTPSGPWMSPDVWNSAKGIYCRKHDIGLHFDDTVEYAASMPKGCTFILVGEDFDQAWSAIEDAVEGEK